MNSYYSGSMDDCGLPRDEFLKGVSPVTVSDLIAKTQRILNRAQKAIVKLGGGARDSMGETGLLAPFENLEVTPLRFGKFRDPFQPAAYGAFGPSGLELNEPSHSGSLLAKKKSEEPTRRFHPGQRVKHRASGVMATFLKANSALGTARVAYSAGDEAEHDLTELCAADESGNAISSVLAKRRIKVGDSVIMQDGIQGTIESFVADGAAAPMFASGRTWR